MLKKKPTKVVTVYFDSLQTYRATLILKLGIQWHDTIPKNTHSSSGRCRKYTRKQRLKIQKLIRRYSPVQLLPCPSHTLGLFDCHQPHKENTFTFSLKSLLSVSAFSFDMFLCLNEKNKELKQAHVTVMKIAVRTWGE